MRKDILVYGVEDKLLTYMVFNGQYLMWFIILKFGYFLLADQKEDLVVQLVNGKYDLSRYGN